MQVTGEEQARLIEQAITPLFQVTDLPVRSRDASFQAEMREKQMAYGILLDSCGLMEMTEDAIAQKVEALKCSLHELSKVRNCPLLVPHISNLDDTHVSHAITCNIFPPSSLQLNALNLPSH